MKQILLGSHHREIALDPADQYVIGKAIQTLHLNYLLVLQVLE